MKKICSRSEKWWSLLHPKSLEECKDPHIFPDISMFLRPKTLQTPLRIFLLKKHGFPPPHSRRSCWCPPGLCTLVWTGLPPAWMTEIYILTGRIYGFFSALPLRTQDRENESYFFLEEQQTVLRRNCGKHHGVTTPVCNILAIHIQDVRQYAEFAFLSSSQYSHNYLHHFANKKQHHESLRAEKAADMIQWHVVQTSLS